jgi:DNA ligase (NAD+)
MDIEGFGERLVDQLVARDWVRTPADIYGLTEQALQSLDRLGQKSATNLLRAIDRSRHRPLARFIYALGIRDVGESTARDLAGRFGDIAPLMEADKEHLQQVPDIGPVVAESIARFFSEPHNREVVRQLLAAGVHPEPQHRINTTGSSLQGKTFVLTGTLQGLTREAAAALIEAAGGKVSGSVSKNTHFVIAGADPGTKYDKAISLGITVLDEAALLELLGGQSQLGGSIESNH